MSDIIGLPVSMNAVDPHQHGHAFSLGQKSSWWCGFWFQYARVLDEERATV
jgi:hypothetical protein